MRLWIATSTSALLALPAAACPEAAEVDALAQAWLAKEPAAAVAAGADMETALCAQEMLVERLSAELGPPVGYKAGLTSPAVQERFGVSTPLHGVLLDGMILEDGATVPVDFAARPIVEADLVLVVGSDEINGARSAEEALAHISAVHPFIELADLVVAEGEPLDAPIIAAINVGARMGVLGAAVTPDASTKQYLEEMTVRLEAGGEALSEAPGAAVLGNPLNAVLFLIEAGVELAEGDLISVGTMGAPVPPSRGTFTATYDGLPGAAPVSVTFE